MDNNNNSNSNSNSKNNNKNNNIGYISRLIRGITDVNSIRPAVTPENITSLLIQNRNTNNIQDHNFNSNYNNTSLNSSPTSQESIPNVRDSMSENIYSENEGFNKDKIKKTEISFHNSELDVNRINMSNKKTDSFNSGPDVSPEKVTKSRQSNIKI